MRYQKKMSNENPCLPPTIYQYHWYPSDPIVIKMKTNPYVCHSAEDWLSFQKEMSLKSGHSDMRQHRRLEFRDMISNNFTVLKPTAFSTLIPSGNWGKCKLILSSFLRVSRTHLFVPHRSYVFLNISTTLKLSTSYTHLLKYKMRFIQPKNKVMAPTCLLRPARQSHGGRQ